MKINRRYIFTLLCFLIFIANSYSQSLNSLIDSALVNNPILKASKIKLEYIKERLNEVDYISNTKIAYGYFVSKPETKTGAQNYKISLKQQIPWFGTIAAKKKYVNSISEAEYEEVLITSKKLVLNVSKSYYNLFLIKETRKLIKENISILDRYMKFVNKSIEVGNASLSDLLKVRIRRNQQLELYKLKEKDYEIESINLNKLLDRDENINIEFIDSVDIDISKLSIKNFDFSKHSEILKFDRLYNSIANSELVNRKDRLPKIEFGLDYINVAKTNIPSVKDDGKDIFMPMASISIPIFSKKNRSISRQNKMKIRELEMKKLDRLNTLKSLFLSTQRKMSKAIIDYNFQKKNINNILDIEKLLLKEYETGKIDINDILDINESLIKFKIKKVQALKKYNELALYIDYIIK